NWLRGQDDRVQADRETSPRWKTSIDGHGKAGQESSIRESAAIDIDRLTSHKHYALRVSKNRHRTRAHGAAVVAEDIKRRQPKLLPTLKACARLLQERLDEVD